MSGTPRASSSPRSSIVASGSVAFGFSRKSAFAFLLVLFAWPLVAQTPSPKQAVVETSAGTFIIDLTPATAPNQVAYFIKTAQEGGYDGTIFHRVVKYGMVQGGDPLTKDPAK